MLKGQKLSQPQSTPNAQCCFFIQVSFPRTGTLFFLSAVFLHRTTPCFFHCLQLHQWRKAWQMEFFSLAGELQLLVLLQIFVQSSGGLNKVALLGFPKE
jgi:hypothetical protein